MNALAAVLAHPLLESPALPVPPLAVAALAMVLVVGAGAVPVRSRVAPDVDGTVRDGAGPLRRRWLPTRTATVALLLLVTVAGRLGADRPNENVAAVTVVGLGWPALVIGSLVLPRLWAWLDPWDTVARWVAFDRSGPAAASSGRLLGEFVPDMAQIHQETGGSSGGDGDGVVDVRLAAVAALAWVWFLGAYDRTFSPRAVAAAVALYSVATLAGCLMAGRRVSLSRAEVFGLLSSWWGLLPRRRLVAWQPPAGADLVLGVLAGGLVFAALRLSEVWFVAWHPVPATLGLLLACGLGAALLVWAEGTARRRGCAGAAVVAAVPATASLALALAFTNDRLWLALQLLPAVLDDPLGRGWDLLGGVEAAVRPFPLGLAGRVWLQIAILLAGHVLGAAVVRRRTDVAGRRPPIGALAILLGAAVLAVAAP